MQRMLSFMLVLLMMFALSAGAVAETSPSSSSSSEVEKSPSSSSSSEAEKSPSSSSSSEAEKSPSPSSTSEAEKTPSSSSSSKAEIQPLGGIVLQSLPPAGDFNAEDKVDSIGDQVYLMNESGVLEKADASLTYYSSSVYYPLLTSSSKIANKIDAVSNVVVDISDLSGSGVQASIVKKKHHIDGVGQDGYFIVIEMIEPGSANVVLNATLKVTKNTEDAGGQWNFNLECQIANLTFAYPKMSDMVIRATPQLFDSSVASGDFVFSTDAAGVTFSVNATGQTPVVLQFNTQYQSYIASDYVYANLDFYNFKQAVFLHEGTLVIPAKSGSFLYQETDGVEVPPTGSYSYDSAKSAFVIKTNTLKTYIVSDAKLTLGGESSATKPIASIGDCYYATDSSGVVRKSTENSTYMIDSQKIYIPLYAAGSALIDEPQAVKNMAINLDLKLGGYDYSASFASAQTDLSGTTQAAYFIMLSPGNNTPFLQDTVPVSLTVEHYSDPSIFSTTRDLSLTVGYPVVKFAVTATPTVFATGGLGGGMQAILLDGPDNVYILADLTGVNSVTLAYDELPRTIASQNPAASPRFYNVTAELPAAAQQSAKLYIKENMGTYMYRLDGQNPVILAYQYDQCAGALLIKGAYAGSFIASNAQNIVEDGTPALGRVAGLGDSYYYSYNNVVLKDLKALFVVPGNLVFVPLLTANSQPVTQPDAVSDIKMGTSFAVGRDLIESIGIARMYSNLFDPAGQYSYFIMIKTKSTISTSDNDVSFKMWLFKNVPANASGYNYSFGIETNHNLDVHHSYAANLQIKIYPQIYKLQELTTSDEQLENCTFTLEKNADITYTVNCVGQGNVLLTANMVTDAAVQSKYPSATLHFLNGYGSAFNKIGQLRFAASLGGYLYKVGTDGALSRLTTTYDSTTQTYAYATRTIDRYVVSNIDLFPISTGGSSGGSSGGGSSGGSSGGGSHGGGGGGGGGSRVSSAASATPAQPSVPVTQPLTAAQAASSFDAALAGARAAGSAAAGIQLVNMDTLPLEVLQNLTQRSLSAGVTSTIFADYVVDNAIMARIYIEPSKMQKPISVAARLDDTAIAPAKNMFTNFFNNKMAYMQLGQVGDYGTTISIAAKINLTGMDATQLHFYSYDTTTNSYTTITAPNSWIDVAGYVHFDTSFGGYIIISEGPLTLRG